MACKEALVTEGPEPATCGPRRSVPARAEAWPRVARPRARRARTNAGDVAFAKTGARATRRGGSRPIGWAASATQSGAVNSAISIRRLEASHGARSPNRSGHDDMSATMISSNGRKGIEAC
jgi:hypothetical protein